MSFTPVEVRNLIIETERLWMMQTKSQRYLQSRERNGLTDTITSHQADAVGISPKNTLQSDRDVL